jgi:hypothetical protein
LPFSQSPTAPITGPELYPVTINYSDTSFFDSMYVNVQGILYHKSFPERGVVKVNLILVSDSTATSPQQALNKLDSLGFRPANIIELLSFGLKYPNKLNVPVVELGSVWNDSISRDSWVATFTGDNSKSLFLLNLYNQPLNLYASPFQLLVAYK